MFSTPCLVRSAISVHVGCPEERQSMSFPFCPMTMAPSGVQARSSLPSTVGVSVVICFVFGSSSRITHGLPCGLWTKLTVPVPGRMSSDRPMLFSMTSPAPERRSSNCIVFGSRLAPSTNVAICEGEIQTWYPMSPM